MRRLYLNGKLIGKTDDAGTVFPESVEQENLLSTLQMGDDRLEAVIDAVRVSKTARYDKEFTPPAELTKEDDTFALYLFNEGQGDVLRDSSGNGYDAKITGAKWVQGPAPPTAAGVDGHALEFNVDAAPPDLHEVDVPTLKDEENLTIEFWMKRDARHVRAHSQIMGFGWAKASVSTGPEGVLRAPHSVEHPLDPRDSQEFFHVATVRDATQGEMRFYVRGKLVGRSTRKQDSLAWRHGQFKICGLDHQWKGTDYPRYYNNFVGMIDETRISNIARYDEEFTPQRRFEPDEHTQALYHFDEGEGDVLRDSSGNDHHGKIVGAKWVGGGAIGGGDQAAVARWLLENKKLNMIGFDVGGKVEHRSDLPTGPCKVRELSFHKFNNGGNVLEEDIPRLAVFTDLEYLDLSRMPLTDAGLASLAPLKKLKTLSVAETALTPASVATIRAFPQLELIVTPSTDDWLEPLAGMPSIRTLFYYRQGVSPQAMEWFKQYPNLTELRFVECGADWTNEKLAPLKDCKQLSKLELSYTPSDDTNVEFFSSLKGLVELNVTGTTSPKPVSRKSPPRCRRAELPGRKRMA
jgi:hypothetical protein